MSEEKKISVIMPVYNTERYLYRSVGSIINQTYSNIELILIDDGSTDSSGVMCDLFAHLSSKIKVIHQNNAGVSVARNIGLKHATGDYIHFCDSDDFLENNAYEIIMEQMLKENADAAYFGWSRDFVFNSISQSDDAFRGVGTQYDLGYYMLIQCGPAGNGYGNYIWNKIFRKECLINKLSGELTGFDETVSVAEDGIWLVDILENLKKGVFIPDALYHYVANSSSVMSSKEKYTEVRLASQQNHIRMLQKLKKINLSLYEVHKATCNKFFLYHLSGTGPSDDELVSGTIKNLYEVNDGQYPKQLIDIINEYNWLTKMNIENHDIFDRRTVKLILVLVKYLRKIKGRIVKK